MTTSDPQRREPGESHSDRSPENAQPEPRTLTAEEQEIVDLVARSEGREWADSHVHLILNQARLMGDL